MQHKYATRGSDDCLGYDCGCTCHCCVFPDCLENPKTNENTDESQRTIENTSHNGIYVKTLSMSDLRFS